MKLTVLFDLDDTLLTNDLSRFLPPYLKALGEYLAPLPAEKVVHALLAATQRMVHKQEPAETLEETFDRAFYRQIGKTKEELRPTIDRFYAEAFPTLRKYTETKPEAIRLVESAFRMGHEVVIATNPLFPRTAVLQRLEWAGLPVHRYPFSLVTTYEHLHFAKPNPAYYAEILAQLGWKEQPAVMIGNSLEDDLLPADRLGIPGFWITAEKQPLPANLHPKSSAGSLEQALAWLQELSTQEFVLRFNSPDALMAVLSTTPAALDTLTRALSDAEWRWQPTPQEWSVTQIACHLRDVDQEVHWPRITKVFQEENPFLPGIETDTWAIERSYQLQDGKAALQSFLHARTRLLSLLCSFNPEDWQRSARHAIFGPTRLIELIAFIATHDRTHIRQVVETIRQAQGSNWPLP